MGKPCVWVIVFPLFSYVLAILEVCLIFICRKSNLASQKMLDRVGLRSAFENHLLKFWDDFCS